MANASFVVEGLLMDRASLGLPSDCKGSAQKSTWTLGLVLAGLIVVGLPAKPALADTILNSGTTTISTATGFEEYLYVATTGTATLNVITGGSVDNSYGYIGTDIGGVGTVTVSGGTWSTESLLTVGGSGTGTLNVTGGRVSNGLGYLGVNGYLGFDAGSVGTATVSGGAWENSGNLYIGNSGTGTLNVTGGSVTNTTGYLGFNAGSVGTATVSGSGKWANSGELYVGNSGTGTLTVDGGSVTNTTGYLRTGTATVSSGTWDNSGSLYVGHYGTGTLNVNGGMVTSTTGWLGYGGVGTATVSSGTWANSGNLYIGDYGTGTLNVSGGRVTNTNGILGGDNDSVGTATVSSGTWANLGDLSVGIAGTGTLNVTGGSVTNTHGYLGYSVGVGTAEVSSGTWANSGNLYVGYGGTGVLAISGSGVVTNSNAYVGYDLGYGTVGVGTATVSSGTWANSGDLLVGVSGTGTLTMSGGLVTVGGTLSQGTYGTIDLNSGGTLQIGVGGTTGVLGVNALTNNGTLIFNRSDDSTYSGIISGTGAVTKQGGGMLTLTGTSNYTGATAVNGGSMLVNGRLGNTVVSVGNGALLGGSGTIDGVLTVLAGGTLSPGNSPGVLTVGSLSLSDGSTTLMEINNTSLYDQIVGTGTLTYGGNLDLVISGSYANGTTFNLFRNFSTKTLDFADVGLDATGEYASLTFTGTDGVWTSTWTTNQQRLVFSTTTGNLVVVPEPSTYAMAVAGLAFGGWQMMRRRRLRKAAGLPWKS